MRIWGKSGEDIICWYFLSYILRGSSKAELEVKLEDRGIMVVFLICEDIVDLIVIDFELLRQFLEIVRKPKVLKAYFCIQRPQQNSLRVKGEESERKY